ncbi:DNA-binding NtrC family response regulator [Natronocella acetinitrilica]|uniref:DNA-binding NtrC family response regulator n=1 Tax=Natronocella acetinitrilica TaxID=414046 RepID=A0AAE3KCN6_9GAMM|nr:sigma-54 dependent transcriptional regulator [Natronocella acetinitrilica]MCP1675198.1 DNA-binding NtrC family response regulator [Natronocella acetinitrilica]
MSSKAKSRQAEQVLLVEDDRGLRELLTDELRDAGVQVTAVESAEAALDATSKFAPALIISDLRLPGRDGFDLLQEVRAMQDSPAFLIITGFGTISQAVEALKQGADEFLTKPLDLEHFMLCVNRLLETRRLRGEVQRYRGLVSEDHFHGLVGQSRSMQSLYDQIRQLGQAVGPVLVIGESGTGKELVARAVHDESHRASGPFQAVNCAGVPAELLESEFFGHEAGAFTGAVKAHKGLFDQANGGTLFLDELGEMPLALQAKLLRVLQDGVIRPVGGSKEHTVDVRIVAATNRNLEERIEAGEFREDLFYRLETFTLRVPPLRERGEDLELLAALFLTRFAMQMERDIQGFSGDALATLKNYAFPGNVRELQNAVERAVTFCQGDTINVEHLPMRIRGGERRGIPAEAVDQVMRQVSDGPMLPTLAELEHRYIRYVLDQVGGNKRRAAAMLDVSRRTLYRKLDEESGTV